MHLLESGVDVNVIRGWLDHVSLDTTNRDAEINIKMKQEARSLSGAFDFFCGAVPKTSRAKRAKTSRIARRPLISMCLAVTEKARSIGCGHITVLDS
ncbi:hypothetical protein [Phyllobacterium phragmitis]|uniref:hypothetical protein n=1 Tax=Phyllobacterium phragmitis TaxID=2670329 RepID=UPI001FDF8714|nr:hypothetical protein [Phyllobacterium phragmitis]